MACSADRIADYVIADVHTIISVSQCVTLRVVCPDGIDTPVARPRREPPYLVPPHRVALPLAAAALALAAPPLLRRLPNWLLPSGSISRDRPLLPGTVKRAAPIRRPLEPPRLSAGRPVHADGRETTIRSDDEIAPRVVTETAGAHPLSAPESEVTANAAV